MYINGDYYYTWDFRNFFKIDIEDYNLVGDDEVIWLWKNILDPNYREVVGYRGHFSWRKDDNGYVYLQFNGIIYKK